MTVVKGIEKQIRDIVIERVKRWLRDIKIIWRMLSIDVWTNSFRYKEIIINSVKKLLFDEAPISELQQFGVGVLKRLMNKNKILKVVNEVGSVLKDIVLVLPGLAKKLEEALTKNYLKELEQDEESKKNPNKYYERDFQATRTEKSVTIDKVEDEVADSITTKITSSITQNIVRPYSSQIVNSGIDVLYKKQDDKIEMQLENIKAERRIYYVQKKDPTDRLPKEYKKVTDAQIEAAKKDIENFKNGSMIGNQHMGSMADAIGRPITLIDEKGRLIANYGSEYDGDPVVVQHHKASNKRPKGHFTLADGTDPPPYKNYTENDCLLNVLAWQTGAKDPNKIRQDAVDAMHKNIRYQAMQHDDFERLKYLKPEALREGGTSDISKYIAKYPESKVPDDHLAGTYEELCKMFPGRLKLLEINHVPPKSANSYELEKDLPCVTMNYDDHRDCLSTTSPQYRNQIDALLYESKVISKGGKKIRKFGNMKDALIPELLDMHLVSLKNKQGDYTDTFKAFLDHCEKEQRISKTDKKELLNLVKSFPTRDEPDALSKFRQMGKDHLTKLDKKLNEATYKKGNLKSTRKGVKFEFADMFEKHYNDEPIALKDRREKKKLFQKDYNLRPTPVRLERNRTKENRIVKPKNGVGKSVKKEIEPKPNLPRF